MRTYLNPSRLLLLPLFILLVCYSPSAAQVTLKKAPPTPILSLRSLANAHGIAIGTAVNIQALQSGPEYQDTLSREFNIVTPENAMKFANIHPNPGVYDFHDADTIVAFAHAHGMQVRGHTLVWYRVVPAWVENGHYTRNELKAILKDHIMTVVSHYRGQVNIWDVVNEAIASDGTLRNTLWLRGIGPDYIDLAFRWAHEANPQAQLFYNDFAAEGLGRKSDAVYALVKGMLQRGVPISGVGLQMHLSLNKVPAMRDVLANMNRLAALGLQVHITEMDVEIQGASGTLEEKLTRQAIIYRDMLEVCLSAPNCNAFVMWGFTDRYSWIPLSTGHADSPLIFDEEYRPKPAYAALISELHNPT